MGRVRKDILSTYEEITKSLNTDKPTPVATALQ